MKNLSLHTVGIASALLCSSYVSAGQDSYVNAQIGLPDVTGFSGGLAIIATYGLPMNKLIANVPQNINFEAEFTSTLLSKPSVSIFEVSYNTVAGYAVYNHELSPELTLRGRAGLILESITIDIPNFFGGSISSSETDIGLSFGFGATYKLGGNMNIIAEYTIIESDIAHLSAGVQYYF